MPRAPTDSLQALSPKPANATWTDPATADAITWPTRETWPRRVWQASKRYPLPLVTLTLLLVSLGLWLAGQGDLARWSLLAIIVIGAVPLLWETLSQLPKFLTKRRGSNFDPDQL
jgi:hypothetical protein